MRWFKKIVRAVLALLPLFAIFLIPSNASALKHEYDGLFISDKLLVPHATNGSIPHSYTNVRFIDNSLTLNTKDSVITFDHVVPYKNSFYLQTGNVFGGQNSTNGGFSDSFSNNCIYNHDNILRNFISLRGSSGYHYLTLSGSSYDFDGYSYNGASGLSCLNTDFQFSHPVRLDSSFDKVYAQNSDGDLVASPLTLFSVLDPYSSTYNGLKLETTSVSSNDGLTYTHSFSFARLFEGTLPDKFEYFRIPLSSKEGYFIDSSNFYQGRQLQFSLKFKFDGSFEWNPDLSQGYSRILAYTIDSSDSLNQKVYECNNITTNLTGWSLLEVSCPITLDKNYLAFIPVFEIYNPNYIWHSDSYWEIFDFNYITDNDFTPGSSFNSNLFGDVWSASDGVGGDGACQDSDFLCKLNNLFIFSIPVSSTPLGSIFGGFTDSMSCASIPTIASMIHSNETSVCPWFNSTIRGIATPILSLASVMITFGFIVRWLGSSSGNNFDDSGGY